MDVSPTGHGVGALSFQSSGPAGAGGESAGGLSPAERRELVELQRRDREVRAHERAHLAAAGGLARGAASFTYDVGPDGQRYAVGGEVQIDTSPGRTPQETIEKARQIRAAALAPADPSAQDRQVAAAADRLAREASAELALGGDGRQAQAEREGEPQTAPDILSPRTAGDPRALARFFAEGLEPSRVGSLIDTYA